ncbi:Ephrin type-B receptor 5 [Chelonia mydas]|uniref:Ephrin type-B receptor 5 n=1 Tax=Chelonia mydas TaxID=8469 RepID=M7AWU1_CHEMY|nr:Ephrin type-B receptor 5 [Chelonia mydas]
MGWLWLVCLFHLAASLEEILLDTTGETSEIGWTTHPPDGWDEVSVLDDKKLLIRTFEVCNVAEPGQNNWLRTHFIERYGAHRVHVRLRFSVRDCASMRTVASSCKETFTLYYYQAETDMATQDLPEWREGPWTKVDTIAADESFSQVDSTGKVVKMNVKVRSFGPLTQRGFYLAFQDSGACMSLVAVQVFFYKCPAVVRGFASFPETFAGGERTSLVEAVGTCVADAEEASTAGSSGVRLHCNGEGEWMVAIGRCTCRPGYQPANDEGACKEGPGPPTSQVPLDHVAPLDTNATQDQPEHMVGHDNSVPPLASSLSSPDEAVIGVSASGPPPINHRVHQDLLHCIARNMGLQVEEVIESEDPVVDIRTPEGPSRVALLVIKTISNNYNALWQTPGSIPLTARGVERKYCMPSNGYEFLFSQTHSCSLVVSAVNEKEPQGQQALAPEAKEAKQMGLFGRKIYAARGSTAEDS